jgi:hypothetical protein
MKRTMKQLIIGKFTKMKRKKKMENLDIRDLKEVLNIKRDTPLLAKSSVKIIRYRRFYLKRALKENIGDQMEIQIHKTLVRISMLTVHRISLITVLSLLVVMSTARKESDI